MRLSIDKSKNFLKTHTIVILNAGKDAEKLDFSYIADGNVKL